MLTSDAIRLVAPNFDCIELTATSAFTKSPSGAMRPGVKKSERHADNEGRPFSFDFPEYIVTMRLSCPRRGYTNACPVCVMRALKHAAVPTPPAKVGPSNIPTHK